MQIERHLHKFTPHFDFRFDGLPLWRQSHLDGFYYVNIGAKIIDGTVYAVRGVGDSRRVYIGSDRIYRGFPIDIPKDRELLGITTTPVGDAVGVFYTDGDTVFATLRERDLDSPTTYELGTFERAKQFNTAFALQQKSGTWLIIPPHFSHLQIPYDSKHYNQFKKSLEEEAIHWLPNNGEILFIHFHHRSLSGAGAPGVIISDRRKLYLPNFYSYDTTNLPFVDLAPLTTDLSDEEFRKKFENPENFALAFDKSKDILHIAFQFDDKIYRVIYNRSFKEQIPEVVQEKGHLINSVSGILVQDGNRIKDLKYGTTMKITTQDKILWAANLNDDSGNSAKLLSDAVGSFHLVVPEGADAEENIQEFHRIIGLVCASPAMSVSRDTILQLLRTAGSWLKTAKFCQ